MGAVIQTNSLIAVLRRNHCLENAVGVDILASAFGNIPSFDTNI